MGRCLVTYLRKCEDSVLFLNTRCVVPFQSLSAPHIIFFCSTIRRVRDPVIKDDNNCYLLFESNGPAYTSTTHQPTYGTCTKPLSPHLS